MAQSLVFGEGQDRMVVPTGRLPLKTAGADGVNVNAHGAGGATADLSQMTS